jgi:hypothetical protein
MVAVAKMNRRKKQDRRRRQQRQAAASYRRLREDLVMATLDRVQEMMGRLRAPDTPASEVADLLCEIWEDRDVPPGPLLGAAIPGEPPRLAEVAEAVAQRAPGSPLARAVAIEQRGLVDGDREAALRMVDELLAEIPPAARVNVAWRAIDLGDPARAARVATAVLREQAGWGEPGREAGPGERAGTAGEHGAGERGAGEREAGEREAGEREGAAREPAAAQRAKAAEAAERLLAAAVQAASDLGGAAGQQVTRAFLEPAALTGLQAAFARWLERTPAAAAAVAGQVRELLEILPDDAAEVIPLDRAEALARCHALLLSGREADGEEGPDDDSDALIRWFAADSSASPAQAEAARRWADTIHFGLWQLEQPPAGPAGCHLTDLVTSVAHFVPLDPASAGPLARWSVLLGALVCVDGVWRPAAPMLPLSPLEGDALAELVERMSELVGAELSGKPRPRSRAAARPAPFGTARPHGVIAAARNPAPPPAARLLNMITGSALARLIAEVAAYRLGGPRLHNTDGDPMILVNATLAVDDLDTVTLRLAAHPDIAPDEETPGGFTWWGRPLTAAEREPLLAQAAAQLGVDPSEIEGQGAARRWLRGRVRPKDGHLVLETNSLQRLERFGDLLRELGANPRVAGKTTVDPAQDMVLPRGHLLPAALSPQASQAWAEHWLDEKLPALKGRTPRQAAASSRHRPLLEELLRQFEWQEDMRAREDPAPGPDLAWLRGQLEMPGLAAAPG